MGVDGKLLIIFMGDTTTKTFVAPRPVRGSVNHARHDGHGLDVHRQCLCRATAPMMLSSPEDAGGMGCCDYEKKGDVKHRGEEKFLGEENFLGL